MKAIIIAAGRAKRMKHLSENLPKCLFLVNGKPVLRHQIDTLRSCGIKDIVVIKGYKSELINYPDVRYRLNSDYLNNNILNSLFYAQQDIEGDVLITYGDILFDPEVVNKLISSDSDIAVVVDINWKQRYQNRKAHPISEAENVVMGNNGKLLEIGKILNNKDAANGEFIGMMKVNSVGAEILKSEFSRLKKIFNKKPFKRAQVFEQAYLTDMLQELVDCGKQVNCVSVTDGWMELDTPEDYMQAAKVFV